MSAAHSRRVRGLYPRKEPLGSARRAIVQCWRLSALAGGHRPRRVAKAPVTPPATTADELWDLRHVTHDRTVARVPIVWTRQVTVKKTICGVDVSKAKLDVCIEPGHRLASFNNDTSGIAELAAFCREHKVELVVMEASGGYERRTFIELWEQDISCALTNPRSVRRYAEAMGILE